MANKLPGVYIKETDLSQTTEEVGGSTGLFVGLANKGMVNSPVFVTSPTQLIDTFGIPPKTDNDYALLGAVQYLTVSPAYFTRVSTDDMKYGKVDLSQTAEMEVTDIDIGPKTLATDVAIVGEADKTVSKQEISTLTATDVILATGSVYSPKSNVRNVPDYIEDAEKELVENSSLLLFSSIGPDSDSS